jgi:hypothetical protein
MKTIELSGIALDWAVNMSEGLEGIFAPVNYSGKWEHGGPIIERGKIEIFLRDEEWFAYSSLSVPQDFPGKTPLVAAMRCHVASILGEEVDIPQQLASIK